MRWIDGHIDLAYLAVNGRDVRVPANPARGCVSLPALREAGVELIFGTIFTEPGDPDPNQPHIYDSNDVQSAFHAGVQQLEIYQQLERDGEIAIVRSVDDLEPSIPALKVLLLMEGADPIRSPDDAAFWFEQGVRVVGLAWAAGTRYAGGNSRGGPLTPAGAELVAALDELGVIHDMSHLSDVASDSVVKTASGPIVATHSNCRALLEPNQHHLRDDQIRMIASRNGIIGLNLYSPFLATSRRATVDDCVAHLEHVCAVGRCGDCVALGSDMDGGFGPDKLPDGLDYPTKLPALLHALTGRGWLQPDIEGFASENWRRFLRRTLPR